jgi:hypothetical protein
VTTDQQPSPDEAVFRSHLERGAYVSGVDRGRWRLISVTWPRSVFGVAAALRDAAPTELALGLELTNYPRDAPTAAFWDVDKNCRLDHQKWPTGTGRVAAAFRHGEFLYLPCDRLALPGHDQWRGSHPWMIWTADSDITLYLGIVHDLLHSRDYTGVPRS